jgi:putative flippase GtrA
MGLIKLPTQSMNTTLGQIVRYGIVGAASNALLYLLYLAITAAGMEHKLAMTLMYAVGVAHTFIFNKRWSFDNDGSHSHAFVRYVISYGVGYLLNLTALYLCVDRMGWPHQSVQGVMVLVLAAFLFVLQKFWVFRPTLTIGKKGDFNHE